MSAAFREQGWRTITLDMDKRHGADIQMDILDFQPSIHLPPDVSHIDLVWASPVCTYFSVMRRCTGMTVTEQQLQFADSLVRKAVQIAEELECPILLENPWTGNLKNRGILNQFHVHQVDYCQYKCEYRKRTGIWTNTDWKPARALCQYDCPATVFNSSTNRKNHAKSVRAHSHKSAEIPKELCQEVAEYFSRPQ